MRKVLHVGCGDIPLPEWFGDVVETRMDADSSVGADIVADMTDMGDVGLFDAVYCSHALEHLHPGQVDVALKEFFRVLRPGGAALIFVPNLDNIRPTKDVLYTSPAGPVTGHDLYYGMESLVVGNPLMAHKCGFVRDTLEKALYSAGFSRVISSEASKYNLFSMGIK